MTEEKFGGIGSELGDGIGVEGVDCEKRSQNLLDLVMSRESMARVCR